MSEMVERVAKLLFESSSSWKYPYIMPRIDEEQARLLARAAIEAMREPTEEILDAMLVHSPPMQANEIPRSMRHAWEAAIDEALK